MLVRLNKYIAETTGISRRQADELITQKKILVQSADGKTPAVLGQPLKSGERVFLNGKELKPKLKPTTILLNKPVGYLSSRRAQGGNKTIYHLLPAKYKPLKTAGRLDMDSSGLMVLSSDGDLIQRLTHPRFRKVKVYEVVLNKPLQPLHQQMITDFGIDLADGKSQFQLEKTLPDFNRHQRVIMHEGRNRQIRRTFAALGYEVVRLHRVQLGPYHLNDLPVGKFREI
jgi:23S rRNA pseudouridine2605 synthase